jgi:hypothetical protein
MKKCLEINEIETKWGVKDKKRGPFGPLSLL